MGGTMWAESEGIGKGSTFTFNINVPIAESARIKQRDIHGSTTRTAGQTHPDRG